MKKTFLIVLAAMTLAITGCANNHMYDSKGQCITCFNNPLTGEGLNHDNKTQEHSSQQQASTSHSSSSNQKKSTSNKYVKHEVQFTVPVNVDVVFIKLKKEFNYQTEQEIKREWGSNAQYKLMSNSYAYDAVPSAYYHMKARRIHDGVKLNIDNVIQKQSDKESQIITTFWLNDPSINATAFGESLKKRMEKTLNL